MDSSDENAFVCIMYFLDEMVRIFVNRFYISSTPPKINQHLAKPPATAREEASPISS
jgi:hypothetical protein